MHQVVSKSFAYIAITAISIVGMFIIVMDVLKYGFGVDPVLPVRDEFRRYRRYRRKKKLIKPKHHVVVRFVYVNLPVIQTENSTLTIAETIV
jgi:hypothetical protein